MFIAAALAILATMAVALGRAVAGPTLFDRILALNVFGTKTVLMIAVLGFLTGRVGADRHPADDDAGVDRHRSAVDLDREQVETGGRRPTLLLTDAVVLRAVAAALEPL